MKKKIIQIKPNLLVVKDQLDAHAYLWNDLYKRQQCHDL